MTCNGHSVFMDGWFSWKNMWEPLAKVLLEGTVVWIGQAKKWFFFERCSCVEPTPVQSEFLGYFSMSRPSAGVFCAWNVTDDLKKSVWRCSSSQKQLRLIRKKYILKHGCFWISVHLFIKPQLFYLSDVSWGCYFNGSNGGGLAASPPGTSWNRPWATSARRPRKPQGRERVWRQWPEGSWWWRDKNHQKSWYSV